MDNEDKPFQDLAVEDVIEEEYIDLDPNDPELLKLRREAGDPTAPAYDTNPQKEVDQ